MFICTRIFKQFIFFDSSKTLENKQLETYYVSDKKKHTKRNKTIAFSNLENALLTTELYINAMHTQNEF